MSPHRTKSFSPGTPLLPIDANLAETLERQLREAEMAHTVDKMFEFLVDMGRTNPWPLWKRFDKHPKEKMEAALKLLIRSGRARSNDDGSVEAIAETVSAQAPTNLSCE